MTHRNETAAIQISTNEIEVGTPKSVSSVLTVRTIASPASTKDAGRVHVGGSSMRF